MSKIDPYNDNINWAAKISKFYSYLLKSEIVESWMKSPKYMLLKQILLTNKNQPIFKREVDRTNNDNPR